MWLITHSKHTAPYIGVKHPKRGIVWSYLFLMGSFTFLFYYYHTILLFTTLLEEQKYMTTALKTDTKASRTSDNVRVKSS